MYVQLRGPPFNVSPVYCESALYVYTAVAAGGVVGFVWLKSSIVKLFSPATRVNPIAVDPTAVIAVSTVSVTETVTNRGRLTGLA